MTEFSSSTGWKRNRGGKTGRDVDDGESVLLGVQSLDFEGLCRWCLLSLGFWARPREKKKKKSKLNKYN